MKYLHLQITKTVVQYQKTQAILLLLSTAYQILTYNARKVGHTRVKWVLITASAANDVPFIWPQSNKNTLYRIKIIYR